MGTGVQLAPSFDVRATSFPKAPTSAHCSVQDLVLALQEVGEGAEAQIVAEEAATASDPVIQARGEVALAELSYFVSHDSLLDFRDRAAGARAVLEAAGDDLGLAAYWRADGFRFWSRLQTERARQAWEHGLTHAEAAGAEKIRSRAREHDLERAVPWSDVHRAGSSAR